MKLSIDTTEKTVTIEEAIDIDELFNTLNDLFPNGWAGYKIIPNMPTQWVYPPYPIYPTYDPPYKITCSNNKEL